MGVVTATRYHDISCGHRVVGHEGKCRHLHGHNYRVHFTIEASETNAVRPGAPAPGVDQLGRVIDFTAIKYRLCAWLEEAWDHKMLMWSQDPMLTSVLELDAKGVWVAPFNPTAEAMARHLVEHVGPERLKGSGVVLTRVVVEETRKCSAAYELYESTVRSDVR